MSEQEYSSKNLSSLSDLGAIRMRPGMYIGDTDNPKHLLQEAIDNCLDESIGKHATRIDISVDTHTCTYTVEDNGRGIPLGSIDVDLMGHIMKKQSLEVVTSKIHAGGKFGGGGYKISSGLHGVGMKAMNALSDYFEVKVQRKHDDTGVMTRGRISYRQGVLQEQEYVPDNKLKGTGTRVTFRPSKDIFDSIVIPKSYLVNKCKIATAFGHNVHLTIDGSEIDVSTRGLVDLIDLDDHSPIGDPIHLKASTENGEFIEICLIYSTDIRPGFKGFTNLLYNSAGGTHIKQAENAIIDAWKDIVPKGIIQLRDSDYLLGIRAVVAAFIQEPKFSSQTKERLSTNASYFKELMASLKSELVKNLRKNSELTNKLLNKFVAYREAENAILASKEIKGIVEIAEVKDGKVRRKTVVPSLVECSTKEIENTELFICEGESALGSLRASRDPRFHGILPLTGKILNVAWMNVADAIKSDRIRDIVNSIGCGVGENSDANNSRYGKIIIAADSDPDGKHINALVICAIVNLVPDIVKQGRLYIAESALYGYYDKNNVFYPAYTKEEIPKNCKSWHRYKGLGELNPNEMSAMFMEVGKRRLIRVEYPDDLVEFNNLMSCSKKALLLEEGLIIDNR